MIFQPIFGLFLIATVVAWTVLVC